MYTVYEHKNKINNKKYIGITSRNVKERWGNNGSGYKSTPYFYSAIQKYGWENFEHNILYTNLTKEEACEKEKELIKLFKTQNREYGYNILEGGQAPIIPLEIREKMSNSMKGNKNGLGHPCSEEKKRKISEAQIGRTFTEEHKQKLSAAAKKRHVPCSEEKKKILSKAYPNKKRVYCQETDTIYESIQECGRQLNIDASYVCAVCKGKHKTAHGYHFSYYNDTINA